MSTQDAAGRVFMSRVDIPHDLSETITLLVGPLKEPFAVHKSLLVKTSDYFAKATTGDWVEARSNTHTLEDVNPDGFRLFVRWLYTSQLSIFRGMDTDQLLVVAWTIGDRLQSRHFKNAVINALHDTWKECDVYSDDLTAAAMAYEGSIHGSRIRLLCQAKFSRHARDDHWDEDVRLRLPRDLLEDLLTEISKMLVLLREETIELPYLSDDLDETGPVLCTKYHEHKVDEGTCTDLDIKRSFKVWYQGEAELDAVHPFNIIPDTD